MDEHSLEDYSEDLTKYAQKPAKTQELLDKYFFSEVKHPNFYQLEAFLKFFGRQTSIFD